MLSSLTIVFREMLEMSMVVGLLLAATDGVRGSRRWIFSGVFAGLFGAIVLGIFMEEMEAAFDGTGEFIFNAIVLTIASVLLAWTVIWMSRQGRVMAQQMRESGRRFSAGEISGTALLLITFSAVIREGSEAAFFLFSAWQLGERDSASMLAGGLLGLLLGVLFGYLMYRGLLRISIRHVFQVLAWLLTLLAAGMASQACWNLVVIEWLPPIVDPLWDTSALLAQDGALGELLHVLMGYDERPSALQVLVFVGVLGSMLYLRRHIEHPNTGAGAPQRA